MIKRALILLGAYLEENGFTEDNPALVPGDHFENEVFSFDYIAEDGVTRFVYKPTGYQAEWYVWVERAFYSDVELSVKEVLNILFVCLSSIQNTNSTKVDHDVLEEWTVLDDEEDD